ncbi:TetR family transcriptional regulator [Micromonospora zingiberis]|uniref:TetR family transcriptional regulator n=1 Tax=Micromonospora zingiberis TaxID=2053011 RepID=A0A4R0GUC5_9ACTN|nr:TetR family transcriptional regulator [Micromonospora zingiberis]TCC00593.1 TetR family transcriptional regulator [Micromonospora zingiberis]
MTWAETDGTRGRILRAAFDLFAEQGYQRTSLRQIAERLELTKAAILYHFPSKGHLLTALAEPMVGDLEKLVDAAGALPPEQARWRLLEDWVDTMLEHRGPLGMLLHDLALVDQGSTYHRLVRIAMRANEILAGPRASRRDRVRAVQAIAMCSDPVVFLMEVPAPVLRADMLDGVRRLLADAPGDDSCLGGPDGDAGRAAVDAGPTPAPAVRTGGGSTLDDGSTRARTGTAVDGAAASGGNGAVVDGDAAFGGDGPGRVDGAAGAVRVGRRRPGRPRSMSPEQLSAARRMHETGSHSIDEIAAACGVSRATLYRYLNSSGNNETVLS